jgi:signal transduction histidine kinase
VTRRRQAIAFVALCVLLVGAAILLIVGWIIANAGSVTPLVLGIVTFALIIAGLIVYTVFLVLEIRRNEEHDTFINAVTHELKTPIASIRLYLETLQAREVSDVRRREFYDVMLADADRLHHTVDQVLKAGAVRARRHSTRAPVDVGTLARECRRAFLIHLRPQAAVRFPAAMPAARPYSANLPGVASAWAVSLGAPLPEANA